MNRREFLATAGAGAVAVTATSGVVAAQDNESGGGNESGGNESGGNESGGGGGGGGSGPIDYGGWFSDVPYWGGAGSTEDMTGQGEVNIAVGGDANNGLSFQPAAVQIDEGATVVWEWTGEGGGHNVEAEENADFASEIVGESGHTFEWTADTTGIVPYFCNPHKGQGMKGALAIGSDLPRQEAGAGGGTPVDPEHMGVPIQPHFVGLATILMVLSSLILTFFLLKYGESAHTKGGNN